MPNTTSSTGVVVPIPAGQQLYVTSTGDGYVDIVSGVPGAGFNSYRVSKDLPRVLGPYGAEATVRVRATAGAVTYDRADPLSSTANRGQRVGSSIMFLGSSTFAAGSALPHLPSDVGVQSGSPDFTPLNSLGAFIQRAYVARGANRAAGAVVRFYVADSTLTWQAPGDTEGPRVKISREHMWYTLQSGTPGAELYIETIPRLAPLADASTTFPAPGGNLWRYENTSTIGLGGWIQILAGVPYARSVSYAKSSATLADMRAACADWENDYTDETHIYMGTNDVTNRATALQALDDMEFIVRRRQDVGSKVIVGGILPVTGRSPEALQAVGEFNLALRDIGERLGFGVWDAWPYVAKPNGDWVDGYSYDGTHMTPATCYLVAKRAVMPVHMRVAARPPLPRPPVMVAFDAVLAPYGNLMPNAIMAGSAAASGAGISGTVPTNFTVARSSGSTITAVCTAPDAAGATVLPDGRQGKYFTVVVNNANASAVNGEEIVVRRASSPFITGMVADDLVILEGECRIKGTGIQAIAVLLTETTPAGVTTSYALQGNGDSSGLGDLDGDTVTLPFRSKPLRITEGATNLQFNITVKLKIGGTATLDIAPTLNIHKVPA